MHMHTPASWRLCSRWKMKGTPSDSALTRKTVTMKCCAVHNVNIIVMSLHFYPHAYKWGRADHQKAKQWYPKQHHKPTKMGPHLWLGAPHEYAGQSTAHHARGHET